MEQRRQLAQMEESAEPPWVLTPGSESTEARKKYGGWRPPTVHPAGSLLFRQGDWPSAVYLIEEGLVKLTYLAVDGQPMIVGLCSQGSLLGSASALLQQALLTTAEVLTQCRISRLAAAQFRQFAQTDPQFSLKIHELHCQRLQNGIQQLAMLKCLPAEERLMRLMWEMISVCEQVEPPGPSRLESPLKCWELAQLILVTPEHLSRLLHRLERQGILCREGRCFIIPNLDTLRHRLRLSRGKTTGHE